MATNTTNSNERNSTNVSNNFTLHIKNLPIDLDEDGVKSIFLEYGQITGAKLIKGTNANQAYISYLKYCDAEEAIAELHEKLPLLLNVQFKDKNISKFQNEIEVDLSHPIYDFRYKKSFLDNTSGKKSIGLGRANCSPVFQSDSYTNENDLLYPVPDDASLFNPYESAGPFRDSNLMYTRGIVSVSKDGRRHISFGRGYTYYSLPEPQYNIAEYLQNICERREKGLYEYAPEEEEDDTGNCKVCSSPTSLRCQKCTSTFYCSKPCQISDWSNHKLECTLIPPLVKKVSTKAPMRNGCDSRVEQKEPEMPKSAETITHTAPKSISQPQEQVSSPQKSVKQSPISNQQEKVQIASSRAHAKAISSNESIKNNENKFTPTSNFKAEATSFPTQLRRPNTKSDADIVFQSRSFLPRDRYETVRVTIAMEDGTYWIQRINDTNALDKLFHDLEQYVKKTPVISPEKNFKCIAEYDNDYYRVIIDMVNSKYSKIYFIDYGTTEEKELDGVWPIDGFEEIPAYARHIRLTENSDPSVKNLKAGDILNAKAFSVASDGTIIVHAVPYKSDSSRTLDQQMANCKISNNETLKEHLEPTTVDPLLTLKNLPNVLDIIKVNEEGMIVFHAQLGKNEYNITLVPSYLTKEFGNLLEDLPNVCKAMFAKNPKFIPNIGEYVCGTCEGEYFRGIVLSTTPVLQLAAVEESRVFVPKECTEMPSGYDKIVTMGLVCKFLPNIKLPSQMGSDGVYKVIKCDNTVHIEVKFEEQGTPYKAELIKWIPKAEQKGIQMPKLTNGQKVTITDCTNQGLIYVQSSVEKDYEQHHRLEQEISKYALNRKRLTDSPVVGQMVLAHFAVDENFYRAIITKIEGEKVMLRYVDYGNEEETTIDKLYILSEDLKSQPTSCVKISLRDVPKDIPMTEEAIVYIQDLILNSASLTCNFTGDPFIDGVELRDTRNENVNAKVRDFLTPLYEKDVEKTPLFQLVDLPPLKIGDVGDDVKAIVLAYYPENASIILGPNDIVAAEAIQIDLTNSIQKYVTKVTEYYIPKDNELCIAKYDGMFYRGLCLDSSASPTESRVFFIDYGNTERVCHKDIRKFTEDFAKLGAFGTLCSVTPMMPKNTVSLKISQRINELIVVNEPVVIKILGVDEDVPNIDIPSIRIKLTEEGLI